MAISFSPDGRFALTASDDRNITMWEIQTGEIVRRLQGHVNWVTAVEYSPDGRLAISASADNSLILWRMDSQAELLSWTINNREIAELDCTTRVVYALEQQCDEETKATPISTAYPIGLVAATSTAVPQSTLSSEGTATATISLSTEAVPSEAVVPSLTPSEFSAVLGENRGTLAEGGTDIWLFEAQAGDVLTIRLIADNPVSLPEMNRRNESGFDTVLLLQSSDSKLIASNDDIVARQHTNSELKAISITTAGMYRILVQSFGGESGGAYSLTIEKATP